jgi:Zn-dependent peptidase ImmA (M78 family)
VQLDRTAIVRIEAGERRITALELSGLAAALGVPLAHLLSRPIEALVSRRTALEETSDDAARSRYRLDARLEEHARFASWLISHGHLRPPRLDASLLREPGTSADPVQLAQSARSAARLPSGPLGALADVLECFGLYLTVADDSGEGASLLQDGYGVAVISGEPAPGRRRWTAAHELGHHLLQDEYHSDAGVAAARDAREQLIDHFAEEFMLPADDAASAWAETAAGKHPRAVLLDLAAGYRMSWTAVVNRVRHLGLIDGADARRYKADIPQRGDFLAAHGSQPVPDLEVGATGKQWRRATLAAWSSGAITAPRAVELLYGAISEDELPSRDLEDELP